MDIKYRRGTSSDLNSIIEFIDKNIPDFFMPKGRIETIVTGGSKKNRWSTKPSIVWLALKDNCIIGVLFMSNSGSLWNLLVHPDYRGKGVGSELMKLAKPKTVRCKWNLSTGDPTEFYEKLGYGKVGIPVTGKDGEHGKKTKQKSIQKMIKGATVPPLEEYIEKD